MPAAPAPARALAVRPVPGAVSVCVPAQDARTAGAGA